jgi:cysteine desulfurase
MADMAGRIYLDWNATAPLRPEAKAAMAHAWEIVGNPSSVHAEGRAARRLMEEARSAVAAAVGADPANLIFTSGGTEANALALTPGLRHGKGPAVERLLVSAIEHASVLAGGRFAPEAIASVAVTPAGVVDLDHLRAQLDGPPALVSIMLANNETGAIQPVAEAARLVHDAGGLLHVDAVQALGRIAFGLASTGADLLSLSAHKIGGPKGVGALVVAEGVEGLAPSLRGGGQEKGRRAGTEDVAGIAGFGAASKAALADREGEASRQVRLRSRLEAGLRRTPGLVILAEDVERLPNTVSFSVSGLRAETAIIGFDLDGIAVSSGSACSSGRVQPSHVVEAMGYGRELAEGAVRLSLGWSTTEADIDTVLEAWRKLANTLLRERRNTA